MASLILESSPEEAVTLPIPKYQSRTQVTSKAGDTNTSLISRQLLPPSPSSPKHTTSITPGPNVNTPQRQLSTLCTHQSKCKARAYAQVLFCLSDNAELIPKDNIHSIQQQYGLFTQHRFTGNRRTHPPFILAPYLQRVKDFFFFCLSK